MKITEELINQVKSINKIYNKDLEFETRPEVIAVRCALANSYNGPQSDTMDECLKKSKSFLADKAVPTTLPRNEYGTLLERHPAFSTTKDDQALLKNTYVMIKSAVDAKLIQPAFEKMQYGYVLRKYRKYGYALRHDVIDFTEKEVLICIRVVHSDNHGRSNVKKDYFIITKSGDGVVVNPAKKSMVARTAKSSRGVLGCVIARCKLKPV